MTMNVADVQRLLEELETLDRMLLEKSTSDRSAEGSKGLALARILRGMTEEEWNVLTVGAAIDPAWITLPLNDDKSSFLLKLQQKMDNLSQASDRDALTGLFNRRFFQRVLTREMEKALKYRMPITLVIMDVDDFKIINDTWGHVCGDRVLKKIADLIGTQIRAGDYAARIGGEEFAVILPGAGMVMAEPVLKRIRSSMENKVITATEGGQPITCTLSIGAATYRGTTPLAVEELISSADRELYAVKNSGKNDYRMVSILDTRRDKTMLRGNEKDFLMRG